MKRLISSILFFGILSSMPASANEEAHAEPEAAAKEGGGHAAPSNPQLKAFQDHMQKMNRLDDKVKAHEEAFQKLVVKKYHAHNAQEKLAVIEEMKTAYAEYENDMDNLIKVKKELRYKFPSEGAAATRNYAHIEKKSPDELEKTVDLGTTLSNTKLAVEEKYKSFMPAKKPMPKSELKKSKGVSEGEKPKIRLER